MENKYLITLYNENQYFKKVLIGKPISYMSAARIYNSLTKPKERGCFKADSHSFKSYDSLIVVDPRIKLIVFYGNKIRKIVYKDGTQQENSEFNNKVLEGKLELIK